MLKIPMKIKENEIIFAVGSRKVENANGPLSLFIQPGYTLKDEFSTSNIVGKNNVIFRRTEIAKEINETLFYNGPRRGHGYARPGGKPGKTKKQSEFLKKIVLGNSNIDVIQLEKKLVQDHGWLEHLRTDQILGSQKDSLKKKSNESSNDNANNSKQGRPRNAIREWPLSRRLCIIEC